MTDRLVLPVALLVALVAADLTAACTIVSAVAANGQVWNLNNEDGPPDVATLLSVTPSSAPGRYGYFTLHYLTPGKGPGVNAQGGTNEAGLTFDFNAIDPVVPFDPATKRPFPAGNDAIFDHVLGTMRTVGEVVDFFDTYWFEGGFTSAQMHVADRDGTFAIISPSGTRVSEPGRPLITTNFDICGGEDGSFCWRYPIAERTLAEREVGLATMLSIALDTRQKEHTTVYTNVQNLTTGDVWFMSVHDPDRIARVNVADLLARGAHVYPLSDLDAVERGPSPAAPRLPDSAGLAPADSVAGAYWNDYARGIAVVPDPEGVRVTYANGVEDLLVAQPSGAYALPGSGEKIAFERDEAGGGWLLHLYLDDRWALTARRTGPVGDG